MKSHSSCINPTKLLFSLHCITSRLQDRGANSRAVDLKFYRIDPLTPGLDVRIYSAMNPKVSIRSLPTELHTQILEYLSDDFTYQAIASCALPLWGDIIRESPRLQRSRYVRFQSAWQNAVAIHRAVGETSGRFAFCCAVRNRVIEKYSMAWDPQRLSEGLRDGGILVSMKDIPESWGEIDITDSFILDEHFLLPFRGTLAQDLKLPGEDVSVSKSHVDSDLRTSFLNIWVNQLISSGRSKNFQKLTVFPSHLDDMTLRSLLKYIVRKIDKALQKTGIDIERTHYFKLWPHHRFYDLEVMV
ncbi:hypothetical protein TWF225_010877 [Orbilia oligospora]|uniref:F-box domain-containing protein n=2 Tax=Orbilia oligospora TaxID=2813651 RepID=A0A8H2EBE0_ORBOL|nr:hypothetical protein TWF225_010877 [Orbilia oligospora]KAF3252543.1 hypothetical protein TWF217_007737 [Orbilia oligospora]KAF3271475.1 hypothetical protein TWF128_000067 [Orbilia oligospora]TGJ72744.1 hypothetical protein EYR41_004617 [Orbilia oligospora]